MKINSKGLNEKETYCCTKDDVKAYFADADIEINFGVLNLSRSESENSALYRPDKKCTDKIVAKMVVHKRFVNNFGYDDNSSLSFFIINKKDYTEEMRIKFVTEVLPELRMFYDGHKEDDITVNHGAFAITVGLKDNFFSFYETTEKRYG